MVDRNFLSRGKESVHFQKLLFIGKLIACVKMNVKIFMYQRNLVLSNNSCIACPADSFINA